jgi:hypothetical protein
VPSLQSHLQLRYRCESISHVLMHFQAVEATPPKPGYRVAVLGPRRLGMSIIAALVGYKSKVPNFEITAIGKIIKK